VTGNNVLKVRVPKVRKRVKSQLTRATRASQLTGSSGSTAENHPMTPPKVKAKPTVATHKPATTKPHKLAAKINPKAAPMPHLMNPAKGKPAAHNKATSKVQAKALKRLSVSPAMVQVVKAVLVKLTVRI
jgi:hypothetical protein